jgi:hypothetical protein
MLWPSMTCMYAQEGCNCILSFKSILLGELTHKFLRQVMNLFGVSGSEIRHDYGAPLRADPHSLLGSIGWCVASTECTMWLALGT